MPERFGYYTWSVQLSSLVFTGQMMREHALEQLSQPAYDLATNDEEFVYIATRLGISADELREYFTMPKKYYWDYRNYQNIFRFGAKAMHLMGLEKGMKRKK